MRESNLSGLLRSLKPTTAYSSTSATNPKQTFGAPYSRDFTEAASGVFSISSILDDHKFYFVARLDFLIIMNLCHMEEQLLSFFRLVIEEAILTLKGVHFSALKLAHCSDTSCTLLTRAFSDGEMELDDVSFLEEVLLVRQAGDAIRVELLRSIIC